MIVNNTLSLLLLYLHLTLTKVRRDCVQLCIVQPGDVMQSAKGGQQSLQGGKMYIIVSLSESVKLAGRNRHPTILRILVSGALGRLYMLKQGFYLCKCKM